MQPILNQIRFVDQSGLSQQYKNYANILNNERVNSISLKMHADSLIIPHGKSLVFQLLDVTDDVYLHNITAGIKDVLTGAPLTITGGTFGDVVEYAVTKSTGSALYQIRYGTVISDLFTFTGYDSSVLEIEIGHNDNLLGYIFQDDDGARTKKVYIAANIKRITETNISGYETDTGRINKLRTTPKIGIEIETDAFNDVEVQFWDLVFACRDIKINGVDYQNTAAPKFNNKGRSNKSSFTVELFEI